MIIQNIIISIYVFSKFKIYKAEVESQLEKTIKILRSDRGGEYTSSELAQFYRELVIVHWVTPPTPESIWVDEHKSRTVTDMVNAMLTNFSAFENLWWEALLIA